MIKRISVTTLTKKCPMYIYLSEMYPLNNTSLSASFGTWVHGAIAEGIKAILTGTTNIPIERLLYLSANNENNPLIKNMMTDQALRLEAERMVNNAIQYFMRLNLNTSSVLVEKKLEFMLNSQATVIVGIIDLGYNNTILDWKTGSFTADEHFFQLKIYAYLAYKLNIMNLPIKLVDVYLGPPYPKVVKGIFDKEDIKNTEILIEDLITRSKHNPTPQPSEACSLCEYKFRCPSYFRLNKESTIMGKIQNISNKLEHAYQYRKLGKEIKSLANKLDAMAQTLLSKHNNLRNDINPHKLPEEIIEERVWTKDILPYIKELSEEEKHQLLVTLLRKGITINIEDVPKTIKARLFSRKALNSGKLRNIT